MKLSRENIKLLIQIAPNVEEADKVIVENYEYKTIDEKLAFLKGMFDVEIVSETNAKGISEEKSKEMSYWALLSTIINA